MKKIIVILFVLLFSRNVYGDVPIYNYNNWCNYCVHYDYTNTSEQRDILKGSLKETTFSIGLDKVIAVSILGYDFIKNGYITNFKKYTKYKIKF